MTPQRLRRVIGVAIATLALGGCGLPRIHSPFAEREDRSASDPASAAARSPVGAPAQETGSTAALPDTAVSGSPDEPSGPASVTPPAEEDLPPPNAAIAHARSALATLPTAARPDEDGSYGRALYGSSWSDVDHNGCNQRDDVLQRDALPGTLTVAQQGSCDHDVLAGSWHDPYTGRTLVFTDLKDIHQAMAIQIDHVVPLAEAWYSGARNWTPAKRAAFANDLGELLAVDGPTNESKGDGDPAAWRPRKSYQCTYAVRWIDVKSTWGLAVDPSEVAALDQMLAYCPAG